MQQQPSIPTNNNSSNEPIAVVGSNKREGWRSVLSTLGILIAAPLIALMLTNFVFQSYEVEGQSMETSLQHQDRLLIWKVSRTWAKITGHTYIPERGDVIIFVKHGLAQVGGGDKQLIKRVIGVPGDRVVVRDGTITVYNKEHPGGFNPDTGHQYSDNIANFTSSPRPIDVTLTAGQLFVCGDNRVASYDSREFGPISADDVVGRLVVRIFPLNKFDSFI